MRKKEFHIKTYWDETLQLYIKEAIPESEKHLQEIVDIHNIVSQDFKESTNIDIVKTIYISKNKVWFEPALWNSLMDMVNNQKITTTQALEKVVYILNQLKQEDSWNKTDRQRLFGKFGWCIYNSNNYVTWILDITMSNILRDKPANMYTLIDQERYSKSCIPRKLLVFRAINVMKWRWAIKSCDYIHICKNIWIKRWQIPIMLHQENNFQYYVSWWKKPNIITFLQDIYKIYAKKF